MARAFLLSPKISDAGAITASTSVANTAAVNVLRARPTLYWRSTNTSPYLEENLGASYTVDTFIQGFVNARVSDLFRLRLAATQANLTNGSHTYDSGSTNLWPTGSDLSAYAKIHRVLTFAPVLATWLRVDYTILNADGYAQVGRTVLGKRIEPLTSVKSGWTIGGVEEIAETTDMGGEESPRPMGTKRSVTVTWHNLTESERKSIYEMLLERGSAKDIVLSIEGSEGEHAMSRVYIGRVKHAHSFQQTMIGADGVHLFTVTLTVNELAPIEMR